MTNLFKSFFARVGFYFNAIKNRKYGDLFYSKKSYSYFKTGLWLGAGTMLAAAICNPANLAAFAKVAILGNIICKGVARAFL